MLTRLLLVAVLYLLLLPAYRLATVQAEPERGAVRVVTKAQARVVVQAWRTR